MKTLSSGAVAALAAIAALFACGPQAAAQQSAMHDHSPTAQAAELRASRHRFSPELEKIKSLAGKWRGTTYRKSEGTSAALMTYVVTGAGSAVVEVMFPGTPGEMTTVYHDDSSGHLVADHYCNAGNQPKLRLSESSGSRLKFVLADDADIKAAIENHAHELTTVFGADGSLTHDWLNYYLGAPAAARNISLTKMK